MTGADLAGGQALQRSRHLVARQADAGIGQGAIDHDLFGGLGKSLDGQESDKGTKQEQAQFHDVIQQYARP